MDLFALTRRLIDIESITPNESAMGNWLCNELQRGGWEARKMPVENARANVLATWPGHAHPEIVFSTHMDTVPPFIKSSEDDQRIYGRGACDAKGIIARAAASVERADATLATLQDSMLPVEVGDPELRAGLEDVRKLLGEVPGHARQFVRTLGR